MEKSQLVRSSKRRQKLVAQILGEFADSNGNIVLDGSARQYGRVVERRKKLCPKCGRPNKP